MNINSIDDFKKEYILNHDLVIFLLTNSEYEQQRDAIFSILNHSDKKAMEFIGDFIDNGIGIDVFIRYAYWYQINVFDLKYHSSTSDKKMAQYFKLIIENVDINDIKTTSKKCIKPFLPIVIADNPNNNYDIFRTIATFLPMKLRL